MRGHSLGLVPSGYSKDNIFSGNSVGPQKIPHPEQTKYREGGGGIQCSPFPSPLTPSQWAPVLRGLYQEETSISMLKVAQVPPSSPSPPSVARWGSGFLLLASISQDARCQPPHCVGAHAHSMSCSFLPPSFATGMGIPPSRCVP